MSSPPTPLIDAARAEPPAAVIAQIIDAGARHERLRRSGRELRFGLGSRPGEVEVELVDSAHGRRRTVSVAEAFALACPAHAV